VVEIVLIDLQLAIKRPFSFPFYPLFSPALHAKKITKYLLCKGVRRSSNKNAVFLLNQNNLQKHF